MRFVARNRDGVAVFLSERHAVTGERWQALVVKRDLYERMVCQIVTEGRGSGEFADLPPELVAKALLGMANWAYTWFRQAGRESPARSPTWSSPRSPSRGLMRARSRAGSADAGLLEAFAQLVLADLADRGLRQLGLEGDDGRDLEAREALAGSRRSSSRRSVSSAPSATTITAATASSRIGSGTPMIAASATSGWSTMHRLDLDRRDVLPGALDHVLLAVEEVEVALVVGVGVVAGVEAAVADRRGGRRSGSL